MRERVLCGYLSADDYFLSYIGAGSGVWTLLNAAAEKNPRTIRENRWYYVWALAKKGDVQIL